MAKSLPRMLAYSDNAGCHDGLVADNDTGLAYLLLMGLGVLEIDVTDLLRAEFALGLPR